MRTAVMPYVPGTRSQVYSSPASSRERMAVASVAGVACGFRLTSQGHHRLLADPEALASHAGRDRQDGRGCQPHPLPES